MEAENVGEELRPWGWLVGRKFSLGEVTDVCNETATVRAGDDEFRISVSELLAEDDKQKADE